MVIFSHMIFYVRDIPSAIVFYKKAFGIDARFVHESNTYAELETGATAIAFAIEALGDDNLPSGYIKNDLKQPPCGAEITFTVDDVAKAYEKAIKVGAQAVALPKEKPWGQTVAFVRDPNGLLIELASPMNG